MWKTYASAQAGIAIKSTVGRLKQSFRAIPEPVFVAQVEYRDYETVELVHDLMNVYVPAFWKQAAFAAEAELRCAVFDAAMSEAGTTRFGETGVSLPADLETMIDSIVVSPAAPPWYRSAVAATVHKFGLNSEVQPSVLTTDPSF